MKLKQTGKKLLAGGIAALMLASSAWAASPKQTMFQVYEANRKDGTANYITEDFVLLGHSLMLSQMTIRIEQQLLAPQLAAFSNEMLAALAKKKGATAEANKNYFAVLSALLAGDDGSASKNEKVQKELARILSGKEQTTSPLSGLKMDYSRFTPRGHYAGVPERENWFRAMTWTALAWFPVVDSKATGETAKNADQHTAQAMQIAEIIGNSKPLQEKYRSIDKLLAAVFGSVEDFTWNEYVAAAKTHKKPADLRKYLAEKARKDGHIPAIQDGLLDASKLGKGETPGYVLLGMRLFPGRYTPDAAAMQRLAFPETGEYTGKEKKELPFAAVPAGAKIVKGFTPAYELMGLLGSAAGKKLSETAGNNQFQNYDAAYKKAQVELANPSNLVVNTSLIRFWLTEGDAEKAKRHLNSMLGYWTWGRYTSLLFVKQPNTAVSKGLILPPKDERPLAYLAPETGLYLRLLEDVNRLEQAFSAIGIDNTKRVGIQQLESYKGLLLKLVDICRREKAGKQITPEQSAFLNDFDKKLFAITKRKDAPIVVDVQTDGNSGMVLEEALGYAALDSMEIGKDKHKVVGALFTHYEFKKPLAERMTDQQWIKQLQQQ